MHINLLWIVFLTMRVDQVLQSRCLKFNQLYKVLSSFIKCINNNDFKYLLDKKCAAGKQISQSLSKKAFLHPNKRGGQNILLTPPFFKRGGHWPRSPPPWKRAWDSRYTDCRYTKETFHHWLHVSSLTFPNINFTPELICPLSGLLGFY